MDHRAVWDNFCERHEVADNAVPLFQLDPVTGTVVRRPSSARLGAPLLVVRSPVMEVALSSAADAVVQDYRANAGLFDGLLYMMLWLEESRVIPLYIGKTEKYGHEKDGQPRGLSANIANMRDRSKFARWGNGYAYHIGDLSAVVCPGHAPGKARSNYRRWAERLFINPSVERSLILRRPTFFWVTPWLTGSVGPWVEFGSTSLCFTENLCIGLAERAFPRVLLNSQGINRDLGLIDGL